MALHKKTRILIAHAREILMQHNPMTVRQLYYQLVSGQVLKNCMGSYKTVVNALVDARKAGLIPWQWLEDRLRRPRSIGMWNDLSDFADTVVTAYRRDVWSTQQIYVEVWLEKDALSGIFEDVLRGYGITLNVGRGYDGWDSIRNAAMRYEDKENVVILYFGDFDPSGMDMTRSLKERLEYFDCFPEIRRCALNADDIAEYNLPPDFTKAKDTRRNAFIAEYGDMAVELDALPVDVLRSRLKNEIASILDMEALQQVKLEEAQDKERLRLSLDAGH